MAGHVRCKRELNGASQYERQPCGDEACQSHRSAEYEDRLSSEDTEERMEPARPADGNFVFLIGSEQPPLNDAASSKQK
jgi:hypothetical protein